MLQLPPSDQQIYCLLRCDLYQGFSGTSLSLDSHTIAIEVILKIKIHDWNDITTPTQNTTKQCVYIMGNTVHMETASCMMTSSNGNIFRVTGPLCGDSPVTGAFPAQRPAKQSCDCLVCTWTNSWANNEDAGDLRRHRTHYDVIVMGRLGDVNILYWYHIV